MQLIIKKIREKGTLCFKEITIEEMENEIHNLSSKKASENTDIPTRIITENADIFVDYLYKSIYSKSNALFKSSIFFPVV